MDAPLTLPAPRTPDPATAPPLRWGILGPGGIAATMVESLRSHTRQRVVAVGSRSRARADAFAQRWGIERAHDSYEALVADPAVDAVYIASPHSHHAEHALLAIAAGKHVLVEKAFARNAAEARAVIDAASAAGVTLVEAMWTRFLPRIDVVRQVLADGVLGDLELVQADHGQAFAGIPPQRLVDPWLAGGALLDLGIYPVSFACFALGVPQRLAARGTLTDTDVDRQISAVFEGFPAHPHAHALVTTTLAASTPTAATIAGTKARLELDGPFYTPGPVRLVDAAGHVTQWDDNPIQRHRALCYEAAHVATLVGQGRRESPLLGWDETLAIMEVLDEIRAQVGVRFPGE